MITGKEYHAITDSNNLENTMSCSMKPTLCKAKNTI